MKLLSVLAWSSLLLLALAPATPTAAAWQPCVNDDCAPSDPLAPVLAVGVGGGCVAFAPELGGPAVCVDRQSGCVTAQSAYLKDEVCPRDLVAPLLA